MSAIRTLPLLKRFGQWDLGICLFFNRAVHRQRVQRLFAAVSRLGDGVFWYLLMALLPLLYGHAGWVATLQMLLVGLSGTAIYKLIKAFAVRERPFIVHPIIQLGTAPLDRYSFPSGHTLHAVAFSLVAGYHFAELLLLLLPFTLLVAVSRMVLGLHYPSDVVMGALLGLLMAYGGLTLFTGL